MPLVEGSAEARSRICHTRGSELIPREHQILVSWSQRKDEGPTKARRIDRHRGRGIVSGMDEHLPPDLEERLERLKNKGKDGARAAVILREKYAKATTDLARKNIYHAADALMKPTGGRWLWVLLVGVPLAVLGFSYFSGHHHAEKVSRGERALAKVVRLEEGFCWIGSKKSDCVGLTLEVHPEGGPPFEATLDHDLPHRHLPRVQPGSWLYVAIEKDDRKSILLDEAALSEAPPEGAPSR